jgi:hypothetical protein
LNALYKKIFVLFFAVLLLGTVNAALTDNIIHYYNFDETSGQLLDQVGSLDSTTQTGTQGVTGIVNNAYSYSSQTTEIPDDASIDFGTTDFSLNIWIKTDISANKFVNKGALAAQDGYSIQNNGGAIRGKISDGSNAVNCDGTISINDDSFHMVTMVVDRTADVLYLYVDNVFDTSCSTSSIADITSNNILEISGSGLNGEFDEFGIWNKDLNTDEITELYNSGNGLPYPFSTESVNSDFNYIIDKENTQVILTDESTTVGATEINQWTYLNEDTNIYYSTINGDYNYTITELTDYNIGLRVDTNNDLTDFRYYQFNSGDWSPPTTTFSSTEDTFSLSCSDNNVGCEYINFRINNGDWNYYLIGDNPLTINFSGTDNNIQYYSSDSNDNNETTKLSYYPLFKSSIQEELSRIYLQGINFYNNQSLTTFNWLVNGSSIGSTQNIYYSTSANQDLNICFIGNSTYSLCKSVLTWDTINPIVDANIIYTSGFTSDFDINYNMVCYDNFTPINYKIEFYDNNNSNYEIYNSNDANATLVSGLQNIGYAQGNFRFTCTDDYNNQAIYNSEDIFALTFTLINEDTGEGFTSTDLNNLLKAQVETIDGNYIYDFNATEETSTNFLSPSETLIFSFTYKDEANTEIDKEFDFSLVNDTNVPICVANFQQFYEQRFVSLSDSKALSLYNTQARCYALAGTTHYVYDTGYMLNIFTINKPYVLNTVSNGVASQLALLNGSVASEHNLDAIIFRQTDFDIEVIVDSIGFSPLFNESTNAYDLNIMQIYYKAFDSNNESVDVKIYDSTKSSVLASSTILDNPNEFVYNWSWAGLGNVTDQNLFYAELTLNKINGDSIVIGQYFNVKGDNYSVQGLESIAFILAVGFILFGLTLVKSGDALGWFGVLVTFIGLAITSFAIPVWWVSLLQATIVMIIIYIILVSGQSKSPGVQ